jgi:hypothetical protein
MHQKSLTNDYVYVRHLGQGSQARVDLYAKKIKDEALTMTVSATKVNK